MELKGIVVARVNCDQFGPRKPSETFLLYMWCMRIMLQNGVNYELQIAETVLYFDLGIIYILSTISAPLDVGLLEVLLELTIRAHFRPRTSFGSFGDE